MENPKKMPKSNMALIYIAIMALIKSDMDN